MDVPASVTSDESLASNPVFISYATADRKEALKVCQAIERRGTRCWISTRDVEPGGNYQEEIVRTIRYARAMVLVFSEAANNSDEIKKELSLASRYHVPVMALRIEDVEPSDAFAYELSTRQWIDAFEGWDKSVDNLVRKLEAISAPAAETSAARQPRRRAITYLPRKRLAIFGGLAVLLVVAVGALLIWNPFVRQEPLTIQIAGFKALGGAPVAFQQELRAALSDDNAVEVKDKDATFTLGGTIRNVGDKTQYAIELKDPRTGEMLWSANDDPMPESGVLAPQQIAQRVSWIVRCGLADAMQYRGRLPSGALALYLQHCELGDWGTGTPTRMIDVMTKVVALAPKFSRAWSNLAFDDAMASLAAPLEKKASLVAAGRYAAQRALNLDPHNGYAYLALAQLEPLQDWAERAKLHEKSVSARQSDCGCEHEEYGQFLLDVGRPTEAEREWTRALDMQPRSPSGNIGLIVTEFEKGDTLAGDRALASYKDFWNGTPPVKWALLVQAAEKKQWAQAAPLAAEVFKGSDEAGPITEAFAALGSGDAARIAKARDALVRMPEDNISFTVIPLVQMGATEPALTQLRKDYDGGDRSYFFLMDPLLAPLRTQPGWVDILKRAGLIDYWRRSKEPPEFCKAANPPPVCRTI